jgi:hypothetical protein
VIPVFAGSESEVHFRSGRSGGPLGSIVTDLPLQGHTAFIPEGKVLVIAGEKTASLWRVADGKRLGVGMHHPGVRGQGSGMTSQSPDP